MKKRVFILIMIFAASALAACGMEGEEASITDPIPTAHIIPLPSYSPEPVSTPEPELSPEPTPVPLELIPDEELVPVSDYIPGVYIDLKYATEDNFTGQVIYDFDEPYLRCGTMKKLLEAQEILLEQGYSLLVWDAFRPIEAQYLLWEVYPDPNYVANPNTGVSGHSRGNTVDVGLVGSDGILVELPCAFDEFSPAADREYGDVSETARTNVLILQNAMYEAGFEGYWSEWWHYSDAVVYPPADQ